MEKKLSFLKERKLKQINSIIDALIEFDCTGIPCATCPLNTDTSVCFCGTLKTHIFNKRKNNTNL